MAASKILLVEDEAELRDFLKGVFEENHFNTLAVENGALALESLKIFKPDIMILDHNLPDMKGSQVLHKIREEPDASHVPVIFLTAVVQEDSIVNAFDLGADDYIEKPFSVSILIRRIKAVLNRYQNQISVAKSSVLKKGDLEIDFDSYKVKVADQELDITLMEFNILKELIKADGRPLSRDVLILKISGSTTVTDRTIDVHICSIRKKLNTVGKTIETIRGVGYRLHL